jgi:hypothetical protein
VAVAGLHRGELFEPVADDAHLAALLGYTLEAITIDKNRNIFVTFIRTSRKVFPQAAMAVRRPL